MAAAAIPIPSSRLLGAAVARRLPLLPRPRPQRCPSSSSPLAAFPPFSSSPSFRGLCSVAQALKPGGSDTDFLLKGVGDKNVIEAVKNVLEMARRASSRREILHTDFLTPPVVKESLMALEKLADIKAIAQGGYPQAERCRISVGHPDAMTIDPDVVAALSISGNFGFEPCSHGDFLGAILGTGIVREKLGDILMQGEKGAQILVVPELVEFLISTLDKVGKVPVSCTPIPLLALEYEPPRTKSFKAVEASLRVDALASAGFKISRSKLVDLIRIPTVFGFLYGHRRLATLGSIGSFLRIGSFYLPGGICCILKRTGHMTFQTVNGDVRVNWSPVTKNGATLKPGDVVSVNGKGRLKIGEITMTRKGKYAVELIRFL